MRFKQTADLQKQPRIHEYISIDLPYWYA